ncbi:MAG TPA: hypothetical protein VFM18_06735, partial [Methanosarcina sp.]|nr:hypothetical protein [Methanosarcina sp.]
KRKDAGGQDTENSGSECSHRGNCIIKHGSSGLLFLSLFLYSSAAFIDFTVAGNLDSKCIMRF